MDQDLAARRQNRGRFPDNPLGLLRSLAVQDLRQPGHIEGSPDFFLYIIALLESDSFRQTEAGNGLLGKRPGGFQIIDLGFELRIF